MSTDLEQARSIAERIARRLSGASGTQTTASAPGSNADVSAELAALRAGLGELQKRLAQIEAKVRSASSDHETSGINSKAAAPLNTAVSPLLVTHSPWLGSVNASIAHPSQERFGVEEATVSELVDYFEKEKTCSVEPGGKPCDHCAMCSSRGF